MSTYESLRFSKTDDGIATVTLARGATRNAFDERLIYDLRDVFRVDAAAEDVRCVLLRGEGPAFCAGADLAWMKSSAEKTYSENESGARHMAQMFEAIAGCPAPVIAVVHGHALGGGAGIVAAVDIAIVAAEAKLGFTEVLLGIVPAVISPFVLSKVGETHARRYFLTGEIFDGHEAARIGLAQKCLPAADLEKEVETIVKALRKAGPRATREAKDLIEAMRFRTPEAASHHTVPLIARLRGTPEAQEGMAAFLEKRAANWSENS